MRTLCFTVERLEFDGAGKFMIAGRNCQDELRQDDRLRVHDETRTETTTEFCVDEITFYNRTVTTVDHGHTAGLLFPNDLAAKIRLRDELRGHANT